MYNRSILRRLIDFIKIHDGINDKNILSELVKNEFNLALDRKVFYCEDFAIRFSRSASKSFGNTVLSLSDLQKYDNRPVVICVVLPGAAVQVLRPGEYFNRLGSTWVNEAELEPYLPTEEELNKSEKAEEQNGTYRKTGDCVPERVKIMKKIFDNCTQARRYGPSTGKCLIQLESGDNAKEIIEEYTKKREWYERTYSNPQRFSEYTYKVPKKNENGQWERVDEIVKGDLILFDTYQEYLD